MWKKFIPLLLLVMLLCAIQFGNILPLFMWNDEPIPTPRSDDIMGVAEDGQPIRVEAHFSRPPSFLHPLLDWIFMPGDATFEHEMAALFSRAVPGSRIHAVLYQFDSGVVAHEMVRASASGVSVNLVMDNSVDTWLSRATYMRLRNELGDRQVHVCSRGACIGPGNNHNKIYLFSELRDPRDPSKTIRNVVLQTSENLGFFQRYFFNDMVVLYGDKAIYDAYLNYWNDLYEERPNPAYFEGPHGTALSEATGVRVYFFPSAEHDPIVEQLETVSCEDGGEVLIAQSLYKGQAADALTAELVRLKHLGCRVRAILHKNETDNQNLSGLLAGGVEVSFLESVHSKIAMIDALQDIEGNQLRAKVVFTGSLNRKEGSLRRNDESLLRIVSQNVYDGYSVYMANLQGRAF
jgi:hypothetical protein